MFFSKREEKFRISNLLYKHQWDAKPFYLKSFLVWKVRFISNGDIFTCEDIYVIHQLGGPYWEKLCPRSWVPRPVLRPRAPFLPIRTDLGRWITFLCFSYWDLNFSSASNLCVLKKGAFVLMLFKARDRLQTKTKHYNMIFTLSLILSQLSSLWNKERFLCRGRQFIIWVSNKDKRIDELKSRREENTAKIIQSSGIITKTAQRLYEKSYLHIPILGLKWIRIKEDDVGN